jgi:murein DD-endopeptidase MepM/ murein hydrolase activator NlpD
MSKKLMSMAIGALVSVGMVTIAPAPAQAATARNGACESGEFCLYFNSSHEGSVSDFTTSVPTYGVDQPSCYDFKGPGAGKGECVKNNTASVWNRTDDPVTIYESSDYQDKRQVIKAGAKVQLNDDLYNNNAAHRLNTNDPAEPGDENLTHGLYDANGGTITCGFDGYVNTPGRHEGIDIARSIGSPVRALVSGTVVGLVRGANGSSGLSTIAIYNSGLDRTVIYLHSAPLAGLSEGDSVRRDQQIATEAWRGVSSSGAAHTHVEMRPGRKERAAKSVNDPDLENPNPTSFWNSQHYRVR